MGLGNGKWLLKYSIGLQLAFHWAIVMIVTQTPSHWNVAKYMSMSKYISCMEKIAKIYSPNVDTNILKILFQFHTHVGLVTK